MKKVINYNLSLVDSKELNLVKDTLGKVCAGLNNHKKAIVAVEVCVLFTEGMVLWNALDISKLQKKVREQDERLLTQERTIKRLKENVDELYELYYDRVTEEEG